MIIFSKEAHRKELADPSSWNTFRKVSEFFLFNPILHLTSSTTDNFVPEVFIANVGFLSHATKHWTLYKLKITTNHPMSHIMVAMTSDVPHWGKKTNSKSCVYEKNAVFVSKAKNTLSNLILENWLFKQDHFVETRKWLLQRLTINYLP